jgi:hypothetical protein
LGAGFFVLVFVLRGVSVVLVDVAGGLRVDNIRFMVFILKIIFELGLLSCVQSSSMLCFELSFSINP